MEHRVSQSMICCSAVSVGNNDGPLGLRTRDLFDDWGPAPALATIAVIP
jgi:hypothetical protein